MLITFSVSESSDSKLSMTDGLFLSTTDGQQNVTKWKISGYQKNYSWYKKYAPAEYFSEIIILILKVTDDIFWKT